jgi:putative ABC transport system ATP-binding protein
VSVSAQLAPVFAQTQIELRDVSKDYMKGTVRVPVLERIDLRFGAGEFVALMGSSGSGKTTLLNLIGGLDQPSAGSVIVAGVEIDRLSRAQLARWRARNVGFIFQFYNLLPALTALENVELPLLVQKVSAAERRERVASALALVNLGDRATHLPTEMSGGQQQRVAIARALIADPPILLCDEPTGDLDRPTGLKIMDVLKLLNTEYGKTILVATHDPDVAGYADRVVDLNRLRVADEHDR